MYNKVEIVSTLLFTFITFLLIALEKTELKQNIIRFSKEKNISIRQLERDAGLHLNFLSNLIASEKRSPRVESLISIADVLKISLDELVGRSTVNNQKQYKTVIENEDLFLEILQDLNTRLKLQPGISYTFDSIWNYIFLYYQYCLHHGVKLEKEFGDFLFKKSF